MGERDEDISLSTTSGVHRQLKPLCDRKQNSVSARVSVLIMRHFYSLVGTVCNFHSNHHHFFIFTFIFLHRVCGLLLKNNNLQTSLSTTVLRFHLAAAFIQIYIYIHIKVMVGKYVTKPVIFYNNSFGCTGTRCF